MKYDRKVNKINEYNLTGFMVFFICLDLLLLGVGIYLHMKGILNLNRYWGIFPLVLGVPGLLVSGFNFVYLGLSFVGGIYLCYANIPDKALATLISFVIVAVLGFMGYLINRNKE